MSLQQRLKTGLSLQYINSNNNVPQQILWDVYAELQMSGGWREGGTTDALQEQTTQGSYDTKLG